MPEYLGQHFLINSSAISRIVKAIEVSADETVVEIGPGRGALTHPLTAACEKAGAHYIGIEKDETLARSLELPSRAELKIGDALRLLPELATSFAQTKTKWKLVGNIPYYITGFLLRTLSELEHKPTKTVIMIQKEVAERICAEPPDMNLLASITQLWAETVLLFSLPPSDFDPPPQVHSAVISLLTKQTSPSADEIKRFAEVARGIFKQPRKTLLNNLTELVSRPEAAELLKELALAENARAQTLSLGELQRLVNSIAKKSA